MMGEFINLTPENVTDEHICCIIRMKKKHPGIEAKRAWLAGKLNEGRVLRRKVHNSEPDRQRGT